jgi:hypothetical protein
MLMGEGARPIYSAGDCSVCASGGAAIFVKRLADRTVFFSCPECGCAWLERPVPFQVDSVERPTSFAPEGFCVATQADIAAAGLSALIRSEYVAPAASPFAGVEGYRE